jgi:hypothetical protein
MHASTAQVARGSPLPISRSETSGSPDRATLIAMHTEMAAMARGLGSRDDSPRITTEHRSRIVQSSCSPNHYGRADAFGNFVRIKGRIMHGGRRQTKKRGWSPRVGLIGTAEAQGADIVR